MPNNVTALYVACQNGFHNIVLTLLEHGADNIVLTLLEHGAENKLLLTGFTPLYIAVQKGYYEIVKLILTGNDIHINYKLQILHLFYM